MLGIGEGVKEVIRPDFNRSILMDFQGVQITSVALGKDHGFAASQSMLSRLENEILGTEQGLRALKRTIQRSTDALRGHDLRSELKESDRRGIVKKWGKRLQKGLDVALVGF